MSGVEGAECEDYDEREAGVRGFGWSAKASTTKGTKYHEGKRFSVGLTRGFVPVE